MNTTVIRIRNEFDDKANVLRLQAKYEELMKMNMIKGRINVIYYCRQPGKSIVEIAKEEKAGLIILGRRYPFYSNPSSGSTLDYILRKSNFTVAVFKRPDQPNKEKLRPNVTSQLPTINVKNNEKILLSTTSKQKTENQKNQFELTQSLSTNSKNQTQSVNNSSFPTTVSTSSSNSQQLKNLTVLASNQQAQLQNIVLSSTSPDQNYFIEQIQGQNEQSACISLPPKLQKIHQKNNNESQSYDKPLIKNDQKKNQFSSLSIRENPTQKEDNLFSILTSQKQTYQNEEHLQQQKPESQKKILEVNENSSIEPKEIEIGQLQEINTGSSSETIKKATKTVDPYNINNSKSAEFKFNKNSLLNQNKSEKAFLGINDNRIPKIDSFQEKTVERNDCKLNECDKLKKKLSKVSKNKLQNKIKLLISSPLSSEETNFTIKIDENDINDDNNYLYNNNNKDYGNKSNSSLVYDGKGLSKAYLLENETHKNEIVYSASSAKNPSNKYVTPVEKINFSNPAPSIIIDGNCCSKKNTHGKKSEKSPERLGCINEVTTKTFNANKKRALPIAIPLTSGFTAANINRSRTWNRELKKEDDYQPLAPFRSWEDSNANYEYGFVNDIENDTSNFSDEYNQEENSC